MTRFITISGVLLVCLLGSTAAYSVQSDVPWQKAPANISSEIKLHIKNLYSSEAEQRAKAAGYLGQVGKNEAFVLNCLIDRLSDEDANVRYSIVKAFIELGDSTVIKPLLAVLNDEDMRVRMISAFALGKLKAVQAIEPLGKSLNDQSSLVRFNADWALRQITGEEFDRDFTLADMVAEK